MITPIEVTPNANAGSIKSVRLVYGQRKQLVFRIVDQRGTPVNLRTEPVNPPAVAPGFIPPATEANTKVMLRAAPEMSYGAAFEKQGTLLAGIGEVEFEVGATDFAGPGIFRGEIARFTANGAMIDNYPVWITVEPTVFQALQGNGPLTIQEIRLALLDLEPNFSMSFSNLLDDFEFTDTEIIFALKRVVDLWNETPPPVEIYSYGSFPYRYWWIEGTCGELLGMAATRYGRNRLAYQAGGVAIDDQSKAQEYMQISQAKKDSFKDWMRREKVRINMSRAWGVI